MPRLRSLLIAICVMTSVFARPHVGDAYAMFEARRTSTTNSFVGATFSPSVAPTISVRDTGNAITLTWPQVTISSGATVNYIVMRYVNGIGTAVCTATGAITLTTGTLQCRDDTAVPATTYTYTQQPFVTYGGATTWSLAPSADSAPICVKRCR